jgi:3-dehydroquinate dehydratase-1
MIRAQTKFAGSMLGMNCQVVGTISQMPFLQQCAESASLSCDVVELRLDLMGTDLRGWDVCAGTLEARHYPVIATVRHASEGGKWSGSEEERLTLIERALRCASAVDIEFRSPSLARVSAMAVKFQKALVVSYHDFERTPPVETLQQVVRLAPNYGTIVKIATYTRTEEDLAVLRELFRENCSASLCVLGMGPLSGQTRTEFPRLGSCLTYGYLDQPAAPGQPSAQELMPALRHQR